MCWEVQADDLAPAHDLPDVAIMGANSSMASSRLRIVLSPASTTFAKLGGYAGWQEGQEGERSSSF